MPNVTVSEWFDAPAISLPGGAREFAVGDVHGCRAQLEALTGAMAEAAGGEGHLTFLGDLIDRGPDSVGAVRWAGRPAAELGFAGKTMLLGNHEIFMLLSAAGGPRALGVLQLWARNGGEALLDQIAPHEDAPDLLRPGRLRALISAAVGEETLRMVEGAGSHREAGSLLFVHGGLNPGVPLPIWFARPRLWVSSEDHFAWIRFPFLGHEGPHEGGRVVVHGHTPEHITLNWKDRRGKEPHRLDGWRLGIDGGSYQTGAVAGAEFRDGAYRVYVAT